MGSAASYTCKGLHPATQGSLSPSAVHLGLTSNLGIVCNPYNAVGVVGGGGDFSCTASAMSAGRREGNQDPKLGTLRSSLNPPRNCGAIRATPCQDLLQEKPLSLSGGTLRPSPIPPHHCWAINVPHGLPCRCDTPVSGLGSVGHPRPLRPTPQALRPPD